MITSFFYMVYISAPFLSLWGAKGIDYQAVTSKLKRQRCDGWQVQHLPLPGQCVWRSNSWNEGSQSPLLWLHQESSFHAGSSQSLRSGPTRTSLDLHLLLPYLLLSVLLTLLEPHLFLRNSLHMSSCPLCLECPFPIDLCDSLLFGLESHPPSEHSPLTIWFKFIISLSHSIPPPLHITHPFSSLWF